MRHGSSCRPWEPTRCSTDVRHNTETDRPNLKSHTRPATHQWTSWSGDGPVTDVKSASRQTLSKCKTNPDDVSGYGLGPSTSFYAARDNLKSLPTRSKPSHDLQQSKAAHCSVEENRLRSTNKPQMESVNRNALMLNRPTPSIEVNVARSRCHPRRRPCPDAVPAVTPKLRRDTDCTQAIVQLIVFFSTKLVHTLWSQASVTPKASKDFNGAGVLPLQVFIQETLRRSKTSYSTLQVALFYLILLRPHVRPCQATQQQYPPSCRALQCGRRMFLTALILASKYLQDRNYSARAWSKISGLPVTEINENERHYLELIKYNLHMSKEAFENWSKVVLTICKASGQGPCGGRPESPPSSPNSQSCLTELEQPGSASWWSYHLIRLSPDTVKDSKAMEEYLAGLSTNAPLIESSLSLDTPPSSPESLVEALSEHSSPLVVPSSHTGQALGSTQMLEAGQSPASIGSVPARPVPANLPTPQTTPRYDSAFTFSRKASQADLRCRASLQALVGIDRQACAQANLETCPPPRPRPLACASSLMNHPLREASEPVVASWMSSPESSFSDSSSSTTRSRSSSISSVSSVWSAVGTCSRLTDGKQASVPVTDSQSSGFPVQPQNRANIGTYSFYHPVSSVQSNTADSKISRNVLSSDAKSVQSAQRGEDLNDRQVAQLLASLSSQSDDQIQQRTDPAVIRASVNTSVTKAEIGSCKNHKRNRSSKEESVLQDEVRQFLWNEQNQVCVEEDKRPATHVETADKEAQYPMQSWAHPKKPVPNTLQTKRIALQHPSSEQPYAPEVASDFLRQSVAVM